MNSILNGFNPVDHCFYARYNPVFDGKNLDMYEFTYFLIRISVQINQNIDML